MSEDNPRLDRLIDAVRGIQNASVSSECKLLLTLSLMALSLMALSLMALSLMALLYGREILLNLRILIKYLLHLIQVTWLSCLHSSLSCPRVLMDSGATTEG